MAAVTAFGVVVRIEQVSIVLSLASFQRSQIPANANNFPSLTSRQYGCLAFPAPPHPENPPRGIRHLRDFNASRNAGLVLAVSDLALIIVAAADGSFAHDGISPQRTSDSSRIGSLGFWRMMGTGWVGAMLNRAAQSSSPETLLKYSSTICFLLDSR